MYVFRNTEITNKKASEYETKSLLYLIGQGRNRKDISIIAIDCFNDVTGMSKTGEKLWDVQSKGVASLTPRKVGSYLITLFNNYDSNFSFFDYILFIPSIDEKYLNEGVRGVYGVREFKKNQLEKIREGLIKEIEKSGNPYLDINIENFLNKVVIVEDRKNTSTYVKDIVRFKHQNTKDNKFYEEIFKEIRDIQSAKKNSYIEGKTINKPIDVLDFDRFIQVNDLKMLVINRFVGVDLFNQNMMPPSFLGVVKEMEVQDLQDLILECKSQIGKAFFDKNQKREFWAIFEHIISSINKKPKISIVEICETVEENTSRKLSHLNSNGVMFLSAMIKDGLTNES